MKTLKQMADEVGREAYAAAAMGEDGEAARLDAEYNALLDAIADEEYQAKLVEQDVREAAARIDRATGNSYALSLLGVRYAAKKLLEAFEVLAATNEDTEGARGYIDAALQKLAAGFGEAQ